MSNPSEQRDSNAPVNEEAQLSDENLDTVAGGVVEGGCIPQPINPFEKVNVS
jgi:hypothetical protein